MIVTNLSSIKQILSAVKPTSMFRADATYVIAGGLGSLGQSLARWMVRQGAKHLILLSRSGSKNPLASRLINELSMRGVHIETPKCEIAKRVEVEHALKLCAESNTRPPIKGCIHASIAMKVSTF